MSMILGSGKLDQDTSSKKISSTNGDATRALNFGNISKQVSFNDGNKEGYYMVRPKALMASPHNPRPDWIIDDNWLVNHVGIDMLDIFETNMDSSCLVKLTEEEVDGKLVESVIYPEFENLMNSPSIAQKKEYEFLVSLSKSIRETGQIQPIEIESNTEANTLVVLEGHLRRLACILGRISYVKAIRNEGLHDLSQREKIHRQITENSLRSNVSVYGHYKLACEEINECQKVTVRHLASRLKIHLNLASTLIKLISNPDRYHSSILESLKNGYLSANNLIKVVSIGRQDRQELFISKILQKNEVDLPKDTQKKIVRGTDGRKRTTASMQIKSVDNCIKAGNNLLKCIPELTSFSKVSQVTSVEDMVNLLKKFELFLLEMKDEETV